MRYFLYLSYLGKEYCGWQNQPNGRSVQFCVEHALSTLLREPVAVVGAGRTDAGVHAKEMVAHFDVSTALDRDMLIYKLNSLLPVDIAVHQVRRVTPEAHARFDALSRTYRYYLITQKDPFLTEFAYRVRGPLDVEAMNEAAQVLTGYTDFTSFSKLHTDVKTNNCKLMQAEWTEENGVYVFTIRADRFLRNMVRAIVGTLLDVGRRKLSIEKVKGIVEAKNRNMAGSSVPGHALYLLRVEYPEALFYTEE